MKTLVSTLDASVNFVDPSEDSGFFESRYVRRADDYFIAYISSHTGCKQACRFCHLTQTGQTTFTPADHETMLGQLRGVLAHYDRAERPAERVNVNFMARGEPLLNPFLTGSFSRFADAALEEAARRGLDMTFNVSSIFPEEAAQVNPVSAFGGGYDVVLFWSLYSLDPAFRRRWLPRAESPDAVMRKMLAWQGAGGRSVLHWAVIEGENDSDRTFSDIARFVEASGLRARLNLVRYNPHSGKTGTEAADARYDSALRTIGAVMTEPGSRIVPRVGFDVKASCGMFVGKGGA